MTSNTLIFSRGILKLPFLTHFLGGDNLIAYNPLKQLKNITKVIGWGLRPTTKKARDYATKNQLPYIALEDGFLRSIGLGVKGYPTFSLVYDDVGIYYDTTRPSRLENLILHFQADESLLNQAKAAKEQIIHYQLSKYNHAPDFNAEKAIGKNIVLVIDQTAGDMAVQYGQANSDDFHRMLHCAIEENPMAEIWVKTHPDVLSGKKKGYLTQYSSDNRIKLFAEDVNPLSLLLNVNKVYCVTSQMGFEALLLGKEVITFGIPWYAGWGLTDDRHSQISTLHQQQRRVTRSLLELFCAAYLQYSRYINPNTHKLGNIFDVISYLHRAKQLNTYLSGNIYCYGMSLWKRSVIKPFFQFPQCKLHFISHLSQINQKGNGRLLIWSQGKPEILEYAQRKQIPVLRMEDGFLRSVGLGSNLVAPLSLVVDDLGIYFNAQSPSRLEDILQHITLSESEEQLAELLVSCLIKEQLTKYNVGNQGIQFKTEGKRSILVPGQVEDDASIKYGSPTLKTNLALLKTVRESNPDAYIIYKPHPDVESKNRQGKIPKTKALEYADSIVEQTNILDCINQVDEVHTMTSLAGFEALLRHKKVVCYGLPFYSNWGLTEDKITLERRQRILKLNELIIGVLVYYPLYVDHQHQQLINVQTAIELLRKQKQHIKHSGLHRSWLLKQIGKLKHLWYSIR